MASKSSSKNPPLTISRPDLLIDGSDFHFRRLVHGLFGFLARHEAIRAGHGSRIGLVGIEYTVLISIRHLTAQEGAVSVNRLAEHLHLSGAFVTIITNKLVTRGLIHKTVDADDRRRVKLEVSEKGNNLLAELAPIQRQVNDIQFADLNRGEFLQLLEIIEKLIVSSESAVRLQEFLNNSSLPSLTAARTSKQAPRKKPPTRKRSRATKSA